MYELLNPFWAFLMTLPFVIYLIYQHNDEKLVRYMLLGYALRCILMAIDLNHFFLVPHSGGDSEFLHNIAARNQYLKEYRVFTHYTIILSFIYSISDTSRALAQYFNVILGMGVLAYMVECMKVLRIDRRTMHNVLLIAVLMPHLIIFSGILLREAWIQLFLTMSLYYFLRWFKRQGGQKLILASLACVVAATWMHNGCIAVFVGYAMAFLFYNPDEKTNSFSYRSIISALLLFGFLAFYAANSDMLSSKFAKYEGMDIDEAFVARTNVRLVSGSMYLEWLPKTDNLLVAMLFAPLRMFYYLYSPIPFDWRGFSDITAFFMDSVIYIYLSWKLFTIKISTPWARHLKNYLIVAYLAITFMYSYGTNASGTAIRHRAKSVTVLFVAYAISKQYQSRERHSKTKQLR